MENMKAMEKKIDSQQEAVRQFSSQGNDFQNYGSYRGLGYNQGYNRGYSYNEVMGVAQTDIMVKAEATEELTSIRILIIMKNKILVV